MEALILNAEHTAATNVQDDNTRLLLPHFPLQLDNAQSSNRHQVETFIANRFKASYGAQLSFFMKYLLSTHSDTGVCGALGFQPAHTGEALFLETYLQSPVDQVLSERLQTPVARESVVEIGNLASGRQRATQTLFVLLADILQRCGYDWVVFTANSAVRSWLEKLNLTCLSLGEADPSLLTDKGASWGSYYDDQPVVLACHIEPGFEAMTQNRLTEFLRQSYNNKIETFSHTLKADETSG